MTRLMSWTNKDRVVLSVNCNAVIISLLPDELQYQKLLDSIPYELRPQGNVALGIQS